MMTQTYIILPNGVQAGHHWNDTSSASETNSGFETDNRVVIRGTDDGAMGLSPK